LESAYREERRGTAAHSTMGLILENVAAARESSAPICQDTGTHTWHVYLPDGTPGEPIRSAIRAATAMATRRSYLRPNTMDAVSGHNPGDNLGVGHPGVHLRTWKGKGMHADILLKGGGCENCSRQYALPDSRLGAGRDLAGVRAVMLDAVYQAQGKGCAPGILGVAIGGDRAGGLAAAKEQLFRLLPDAHADPQLAALEADVLSHANRLGIGPMGFGGRTTLLGVKATKLHRLPASFFVSVAYMCWACRRASVTVDEKGQARFSQVALAARPHR
jgi:fumarate hydratase class I